MNGPSSLSTFFAQNDTATLDNCDQEQIHLTGMIQSAGALLVIDPASEQIVGASENAAELLQFDYDQLLRVTLAEVDADLAEQARSVVDDTQILHEVLDDGFQVDGVDFDVVVHMHSGRRIVEFVPNASPSANSVRINMRHCSKACARILHADSFAQATEIATDAIQQIIGYSRVKIYRFLPDWSGKVIAESTDDVLPSYMGLCFPATDIPKQVRAVMSIVPYRAIGATTDDAVPIRAADGIDGPLDLTWSVLRSVSTMHTEYLRNIKVSASFSCSLMHNGELWGLIAAHNDEPGMVPFDSWSLVQEIGTAVMLRFGQEQRAATADMISELRKIENQFSVALRRDGDIEDVLLKLVPELRKFLGADGFAFQYGSKLHVSGRTPPADFIGDLIKWATGQRDSTDQFQTTKLQDHWPKAAAHIDTSCGVLIQPIFVHRVCQLIWFRGPVTQTIHWAGRPDEKSGTGRMNPRKSFDSWMQEHHDESAPWEEAQLDSAREIFTEFLDIIAAQLLLKEENASLRQFAATAAHDLKAPLQGINLALEWMREDDFEETAVKENHAIAETSGKRLSDLTDSLLELAVIQEQSHNLTSVKLADVINDTCELLAGQFRKNAVRMEIGDLPPVTGNQRLLLRLFLNLASNALKYAHPDRTPHLQVNGVALPSGELEIAFTDNGLGIAAKDAEKVFRPLERLHAKDKIEGSGLGLTICQRIMDIHDGTIGLGENPAQGSRFVLTFPAQKAPQ